MTELTREEVEHLLHYDPTRGKLVWKRPTSNRVSVGDVAGYTRYDGYIEVKVKGERFLAHRLIWFLHYGEWPEDQLDHIDHNPSNNKIENLRQSDNFINHRNMSLSSRNKSGACGIYWEEDRGKWLTQARIKGKTKTLGRFPTFEEAVAVRQAANRQHDYHENHGKGVV